MRIDIRLEQKQDFRAVEELTREAFWDVYVPGCDEHLLIHNMRDDDMFIKQLDFVAEVDGEIVGHIAYAKGFVECSGGENKDVILFGPLSVLPKYQGKGIGTRLVRHSVEVAKSMGFTAILIYGDPKYYSRFGFVSTRKWEITTADGKYMNALMGLELVDGALTDCSGKFITSPVYEIDEKELEPFEKTFPHKEKHVTDTQWARNPPT